MLPDGRVMFVGGGLAEMYGFSDPYRIVTVYNPANGAFKNLSAMKYARACPLAVALRDGRILVAGGGAGTEELSAEIYDPATSSWSATGSLLADQDCATGILLPSGEVLIPGNSSDARVQLYNPETGQFRWGAAAPTKADNRTYTLLNDGRVLFVGGAVIGFMVGITALYANAEIYDPNTDTFTPTGSLVKPRWDHAATLLSDGRVLIVGGANKDAVYNSCEIWDPATGQFTLTGWLTAARQGATATTLQNGRILVAGGGNNTNNPLFAELYDPAAGKFTRGGSMVAERWGAQAILLHDGRVLVWGGNGYAAPDSVVPYAEIYRP
jgi:hypothetical protein